MNEWASEQGSINKCTNQRTDRPTSQPAKQNWLWAYIWSVQFPRFMYTRQKCIHLLSHMHTHTQNNVERQSKREQERECMHCSWMIRISLISTAPFRIVFYFCCCCCCCYYYYYIQSTLQHITNTMPLTFVGLIKTSSTVSLENVVGNLLCQVIIRVPCYFCSSYLGP